MQSHSENSSNGGVFGSSSHRIKRALVRRAHDFYQKITPPAKTYMIQEPWPLDKPLVTVIIPCYNYGRFIKEALDSVMAQTYQRFEVLVINDGSTEELTNQVLGSLEYPKTTVIHQRNQGLAATRNNGAALAAGKYICYLDADDAIEPTYLEKTLGLLEGDESLGSCYSWVRCFGEYDSIWKTRDLDPFYLHECTTSSSHAVIRKSSWERVKEVNGSGFLSKYDGYFEDWVFWIDLVQCGFRGKVIKQPLICYRVHKGSLGATHKPGFDSMLRELRVDRSDFFHDAQYRARLGRRLNRRVYVRNRLINLLSLAASQPSEDSIRNGNPLASK